MGSNCYITVTVQLQILLILMWVALKWAQYGCGLIKERGVWPIKGIKFVRVRLIKGYRTGVWSIGV